MGLRFIKFLPKSRPLLSPVSLVCRWLLLFCITSYIVWQCYFSIFRYLVTLEILSPLLIFILLQHILPFKGSLFYSIIFLVFYLLLYFMQPIPGEVRAVWYTKDYFNVKLPPIVYQEKQATVLIAFSAYLTSPNPRPQSYLVPYFPQQWRFLGVPFINEQAKISSLLASIIKRSQGPFYLLTSDTCMATFLSAVKNIHFSLNGKCANIYSDRQAMSNEKVLLCPVQLNKK